MVNIQAIFDKLLVTLKWINTGVTDYDKIILIPIGGTGTRFKNNSYCRPKALINVFGKPLLKYIIDNLSLDESTLLYIVYNSEYEQYRLEDMLHKSYPTIKFKFLKLEEQTTGAAETINIALSNLNIKHDVPTLCLDSDNFYTCDIIKKWSGNNSVMYFKTEIAEPIFSYIVTENNTITAIEEKNKISNNACTGAYGFESYKQLLKYTGEIVKSKSKVKGECYTSLCVKLMLEHNIPFTSVEISEADYHCLGTPVQLKLFYNNQPNVSCLDSKSKHEKLRVCFDLDNTLVTYPKKHNDYTTVEPIIKNIKLLKYLKSFGHTIIIYTARRMKTHGGDVGKLVADIGKITFDTLERFDIPYDEIYFGKPYAHYYIDDSAISAYTDLEKELGFYQDYIQPRSFNSIEHNTIDVYTKTSQDLTGEIYYYKNIPSQIKDMFPILVDYDEHNKWYTVEKVNGLTVSNLYISELLTRETLLHVMSSIKRIQSTSIEGNDTHTQPVNIYSNYKGKLVTRYESYDYSEFKGSEELYLAIYERLDMYEKNDHGRLSCIHGDPVFSNIMINQHDKIKFIDMRGLQGDVTSIYGDWLYDWAKLYQSIVGYDEILLDKVISKQYKDSIKHQFEQKFLEWYSAESLSYLKCITKSMLFTLIPLHDNSKCERYYELIEAF